ncbi:mycofactocin biosynthesis glycosyltransferase MftF [Prauserella muralis]|uniref:Mycofactocin system glycosyltransferase n=1 Tax=Prauserella muralis TaxID=588067 RepID=A0A2V4AYH5_9PSEU|nr:mycofactocin biosynthesis glycosyltransferase MftF [Prauserella muralis]PXY26966.1 mycofactocin system glycosyltransferase [Prauserella muralis]TWE23418.1 mycofactocin system glycosyltransferase [Prauserella muralis]
MKPGTRFTLDGSVRRRGPLLIGGSPLRLVRLGAGGTRLLDRWLAGTPLTESPAEARLARRLVDAGLLHPVPPPELTPADVTLVVPVKDNPAGVRRLLAATRDLGCHVVVDDGSREPVPGAPVRHERPAGPAAARNAGAGLATTPLIAFLDSDTVPEPGWLDALLPQFTDPAVVAVAPRIRSAPGHGAVARYEADRSSLDLGGRPAPVRPMSRVSYVPSAALVVRRRALAEAGGFDVALRFGEDVDLVWRLLEQGAVRYEPSAVVTHDPRADLRAWLRQRYEYGTAAAPLAARHPGRLSCARMSAWSAASWALLVAGRPWAALALAAGTTALLPRKLRPRGVPAGEALRLAALGHLGAGRLLADATRRAWWPVALLSRRGRRTLLAALLPCLAESLGKPPSWLALRVADDLTYGAGVWAGCARHRTLAPLLPQFTEGSLR